MPKNTPVTGLRWTLQMAVSEFGISREILKREMIKAEILPGPDDKYSTPQVTAVVFGDMASEKLRSAKARADTDELDAAKAKGEVILASDAEALWQDAIVRARSEIEHDKQLSDADKERLLKRLQGIKLEE